MGKQGPCCHCGISTTPLWRNGPPDKPVLCNACGSRWRTKGTLMNYMPMHAGGCGVKNDLTDTKLPPVKKGSQKTREQHPEKRKEPCDGYSGFSYAYEKMDYQRSIGFEEDVSTRSSAGSGISYSEGCVQHALKTGRTSGSGISYSEGCVQHTLKAGRTSGAERWPPWECPVPSKRRTFMYRNRPSARRFSHVRPAFCKLNSSVYTCGPDEDLLVEYKPSSMTVEIGLGGVFIRPPVSKLQEQESQASSLIFDNKDFDHSVALKGDAIREDSQTVEGGMKANLVRGKEKAKNSDPGRGHSVKNFMPNKVLLENFPYNKHDVLQSCQSPLVFLELKDIVNFDTFLGLLSDQEQLQLMKHLPSADLTSLPDSLKDMFNSVQFESALANFQLLLSEGVFDSLEAGLSRQVLQHYQQLLTLSDLTASGWMEQCSQIVNRSKRRGALEYAKNQIVQGKEYAREKSKESSAFMPSASVAVAAAKNLPIKSRSSNKTVIEDTEHTPLVRSTSCSIHTSTSSPSVLSDATFGKDLQLADLTSKEQGSTSKYSGFDREARSGSCFSADSFHVPTQGAGGFHSEEFLLDEVEPDILLHVPSNMSFQQAELLHQPSWNKPSSAKESENKQKQEKNEDLMKSRWGVKENSDWQGLFWNAPSPSSDSIHILPNGTVLNPGKMFL